MFLVSHPSFYTCRSETVPGGKPTRMPVQYSWPLDLMWQGILIGTTVTPTGPVAEWPVFDLQTLHHQLFRGTRQLFLACNYEGAIPSCDARDSDYWLYCPKVVVDRESIWLVPNQWVEQGMKTHLEHRRDTSPQLSIVRKGVFLCAWSLKRVHLKRFRIIRAVNDCWRLFVPNSSLQSGHGLVLRQKKSA